MVAMSLSDSDLDKLPNEEACLPAPDEPLRYLNINRINPKNPARSVQPLAVAIVLQIESSKSEQTLHEFANNASSAVNDKIIQHFEEFWKQSSFLPSDSELSPYIKTLESLDQNSREQVKATIEIQAERLLRIMMRNQVELANLKNRQGEYV